MTRTLYLDCFAGASGDMLLGAMLDCGLDFESLRSELLKLGVEGYELSLKRVDRSGISAAKFDVHLTGKPHSHYHHRTLSEIKQIISSSNLSERVKSHAQTIFQRIGEAESKIHDISIESVHFH